MVDYNSYLKGKDILSFNEAEEIYLKMISGLNLNDIYLKDIWDDLINNVLSYSAIRSKWLTLSREEKMEKDESRSIIHNAVIFSFNILCRYLLANNQDVSWRTQLGDERKRIGDFAVYIAYIYGLNAR